MFIVIGTLQYIHMHDLYTDIAYDSKQCHSTRTMQCWHNCTKLARDKHSTWTTSTDNATLASTNTPAPLPVDWYKRPASQQHLARPKVHPDLSHEFQLINANKAEAMEQHCMLVDHDVFTTDMCVGGKGGSPFMCMAMDPFCVKTMTLYRDDYRIRGIHMECWDGSMVRIGVFDDKYPVTIDFDKDEKLMHCWLYSSKFDGGRFVGFCLKTDRKEKFECYGYNYTPVDEDKKEIPVGCGRLCGIFGRAGGDIDCLGFAIRKCC